MGQKEGRRAGLEAGLTGEGWRAGVEAGPKVRVVRVAGGARGRSWRRGPSERGRACRAGGGRSWRRGAG